MLAWIVPLLGRPLGGVGSCRGKGFSKWRKRSGRETSTDVRWGSSQTSEGT